MSAGPTVSSAASRGRLEQLDGLRLCAFGIVVFHAWQSSTGPTGHVVPLDTSADLLLSNLDVLVSFFFLMSGLGLAMQLLRPAIAGATVPRSRAFLVHRLVRLVPLYLVVFLTVWELRYSGSRAQWVDLAWGLPLMQSWSTDHIFATVDPAWYLSVEVSFALLAAVLIVPAAGAIARRPTPAQRWAGAVSIVILVVAASAAWRIVLLERGVPYDHWGLWFAPPSWLALWGAGMAFGLALAHFERHLGRAPRGVPLLLLVGASAWFVFLAMLSSDGGLPRAVRWEAWGLGLLSVMVAAAVAQPQRRTRRALASRPLQTMAAATFGTYLWHAPILHGLRSLGLVELDETGPWLWSTLLLVVLAAVAGLLSHRFIEVPARVLDRLHVPQPERRWQGARLLPPTLVARKPLPRLPGVPDVRGAPALILISPGRARPPGQATPSALAIRTLDDERFVAEARGGRVLVVVTEADDVPTGLRGLPVVTAQGPTIAGELGVGGVRQRGGAVSPAQCVIVTDATGIVVEVLRHADGERLVHQGVDRLIAEGVGCPRDDASGHWTPIPSSILRPETEA